MSEDYEKLSKQIAELGESLGGEVKGLNNKFDALAEAVAGNRKVLEEFIEVTAGMFEDVRGDINGVKEGIKRLDGRMDDWDKRVEEDIKAYIEIRGEDLMGVKGAEMDVMRHKQEEHEARIVSLEKGTGIR